MGKKTFLEGLNPALTSFINEPTLEEEAPAETLPEITAPAKAPEGYRRNPEYIEKRTRRVQLVLQPSVADAARAYAAERGVSLNELVNQLLKAVVCKENEE